MRHFYKILLIAIFASSSLVRAEVVEFPEEELARESVSPVFDQPEAVKKRLIRTAGRMEMGTFTGVTLNDPFFSSYPLGINLYYHFNEFHSAGIVGAYAVSIQTQYVTQIKEETEAPGAPANKKIPFDDAPAPKYYVLGQYEFTAYYGKISFTKQTISNISLGFTAGVGTINLGTDSSVLTAFGLNQRLYITRRISLRADLQAFLYQAKDVVLITPDKKNIITFLVTGGVQFLF